MTRRPTIEKRVGGPISRSRPGCHGGIAHAPQRPVIQQQEQRRQNDQRRLGHEPQGEKNHHRQVAAEGETVPHITRVGPQSQREEQSAQDILPLGHPSHRFHAQGMDREQRRRQGTRPHTAGHRAKDEKEQNRRGSMQQQIGQMVAPSGEAVELAIQHQGEPSHRAPENDAVGKRPDDPLACQPAGNVGILAYIHSVVVVDEPVADRLAEDQPDRQQQQATDSQHQIAMPCSRLWERRETIRACGVWLDAASVTGLRGWLLLLPMGVLPGQSIVMLFSAHGTDACLIVVPLWHAWGPSAIHLHKLPPIRWLR